ncbi:MAG: hypothetical protein ABI791_04760 [Acidobacteriota bacterium]
MSKHNIFRSRITELEISAGTAVERLLLREYGSVFVSQGVIRPPYIVFPDEESVTSFQSIAEVSSAAIGGLEFTLQQNAMAALLTAAEEALSYDLSISPRGPESGSRTYSETVALWASRVDPALEHWLEEGRISAGTAQRIRIASPFEQVPIVLELENDGIFFAKDLSKSIIYSVAPPGSSQHLSMLAFDVAEFGQPDVRSLLGRHGWFQTVTSDLPHFTYLGAAESELPELGLKRVENAGRTFWVPDI